MVGGEVPDVYSATLVPDYQCGLVRMETHAVHWGIHLEEPLTLLGTTPGEGQSPTAGSTIPEVPYSCHAALGLLYLRSHILAMQSSAYYT